MRNSINQFSRIARVTFAVGMNREVRAKLGGLFRSWIYPTFNFVLVVVLPLQLAHDCKNVSVGQCLLRWFMFMVVSYVRIVDVTEVFLLVLLKSGSSAT